MKFSRALAFVFAFACKAGSPVVETVTLGRAPTKGAANAKVVVVEFGDFECPYCGEEEPVVEQILANYPQILFAFKQFPLTSIHPYAEDAAEASLAAQAQGQFWPYHDLLYANQASLSDVDLEADSVQLGLDPAVFDAALQDHTYGRAIAADIDQGTTLGVEGTPTFFINGTMMVGAVDYGTFSGEVEHALSAVK